jgi:hypothetical protein
MPVPSNTFFPQSLQDRIAWCVTFLAALTPIAAPLGITPAELAALGLDIEDYQALGLMTAQTENYKASLRQYRLTFTEGKVGDPDPVFPFESFNAPPNAPRPAGFFQRLMEIIERIRVAPAYTPAIGAALGIIPSQPDGIAPNDVKSSIEAFPAQTGYMFSIVVSNRAEADAWAVMIQPKGGEWTNAGTFTGKSADVTFVPTPAGNPVAVSVRVQLKKKNANYGQLSDIVAITLNP